AATASENPNAHPRPAPRSPALAAAAPPHRPAAPYRPVRQRGVLGLRRDRTHLYLPALRPARARTAPSAPSPRARQTSRSRRPAARGDDPRGGARADRPGQAAAAERLPHRPGGPRGGPPRHRPRPPPPRGSPARPPP